MLDAQAPQAKYGVLGQETETNPLDVSEGEVRWPIYAELHPVTENVD